MANTDRQSLWETAITHLAALVVVLTGVVAVTMTIGNADFTLLAVLSILIGFGVSWQLSRMGVSQKVASYGALIIFGGLFFWLRAYPEALNTVIPAVVFSDQDYVLGAAMVGLMAFYSFTLVSNSARTFCVIPTLALFGLMGSSNINPELLIDFLAFVLASIYLVSYDYFLSQKRRYRVTRRVRSHYDHAVIATTMFAVLLVPAISLASVLFAVGAHYRMAFLSRLGMRAGIYSRIFVGDRGPSDSFRVGTGPITLSHNPVMLVESDSAENWRGRAYDQYTNHGWVTSSEARRVHSIAPRHFRLVAGERAPGGRRVQQTFHLIGGRWSTLFAAGQPYHLELGELANNWTKFIAVDQFGCVVTALWGPGEGLSYQVTSYVRDLPGSGGEQVPGEEVKLGSHDLETPFRTQKAVDLAREITGDLKRPEDKILALKSYLESNFTYSTDVPSIPESEDVVDYFLFKRKKGYCDIFATTLAIMCRGVGLPARVATGFAPGRFDSELGGYLVRESDAHAWVEVLLPGQGWVTVDPAPQEAQSPGWVGRSAIFSSLARFSRPGLLWTVLLGLLLPVLVWLVKAQVVDRLAKLGSESQVLETDYRRRVMVLYERMCRLLARHGLPRPAWQTPHEYLREWSKLTRTQYPELLTALPQISALTELFILARYSPQAVSLDQDREATQAWTQLKENLRGHRIKR